MGIKSTVLESDCLGPNPASLACYRGLWISYIYLFNTFFWHGNYVPGTV